MSSTRFGPYSTVSAVISKPGSDRSVVGVGVGVGVDPVKLRAMVSSLSDERDALAAQLAAMTQERDALAAQLAAMMASKPAKRAKKPAHAHEEGVALAA